jgi:hypothetical protein
MAVHDSYVRTDSAVLQAEFIHHKGSGISVPSPKALPMVGRPHLPVV